MSENVDLPRTVLIDLCHQLGHDPDRVASITLHPDVVRVEYVHRVVGRRVVPE